MKKFLMCFVFFYACVSVANNVSEYAKKSLADAQIQYTTTLQTNEKLLSAKKAELAKLCKQADVMRSELEQLKAQAVAMSLKNKKRNYYKELCAELCAELSKSSDTTIAENSSGNEMFEQAKKIVEAKYKILKQPISTENTFATTPNSTEKISGKIFKIGGLRYFVPNDYPKTKAGFLSDENILYATKYSKEIYSFFKGESNSLPADTSFGELLKAEKSKLSISEQIKKGGVWIYPILILGVLSAMVAIIKSVFLLRISTRIADIDKNNLQYPYAEIYTAIISADAEQNKEDVAFVAISNIVAKLTKGLSVLSITSAVAPLFGLLGTVSGIIKTFADLASASAQTRQISNGIAEALITTEYGLIVAIPALIIGALLSRRVKAIQACLSEFATKCISEK